MLIVIVHSYLRNDTYYKLAHLDSRIQNADQLITVDIERFSSSLSELYSNLAKPFLDLILFGTQLAMAVGWIGPVTMGSDPLQSASDMLSDAPAGRSTSCTGYLCL